DVRRRRRGRPLLYAWTPSRGPVAVSQALPSLRTDHAPDRGDGSRFARATPPVEDEPEEPADAIVRSDFTSGRRRRSDGERHTCERTTEADMHAAPTDAGHVRRSARTARRRGCHALAVVGCASFAC